jgi:hypothetical protein
LREINFLKENVLEKDNGVEKIITALQNSEYRDRLNIRMAVLNIL